MDRVEKPCFGLPKKEARGGRFAQGGRGAGAGGPPPPAEAVGGGAAAGRSAMERQKRAESGAEWR